MFKGYNIRQQHSFPNLNFFGDKTAYGQGGCVCWLRPDFGLNTQTNNTAVSFWVDIINGFRFEQNTAGNQPTFLSSAIAYNNLPIINMPTGRFLRMATNRITNVKTVVFVANYDSLNNNGVNTVIGDNASGLVYAMGLGGASVGINGVYNRSSLGTTTGTTESTTVKIVVITTNLIMVNGITESTATNEINYILDSVGQIGNFTNELRGNVAEIIVYNQALNSDQATTISNQLNAKYLIY